MSNEPFQLKTTEEELSLANRKLSLMTEVTNQDIYNKITAVIGFIEVSEKKSKEFAKDPYIVRSKEMLISIQTLIEMVKEYQSIGINHPGWLSVERKFHEQFGNLSSKEGVILESRSIQGLEIYADTLIERAFYYIMKNSLTEGNVTKILVSFKETESGLLLVIEDNGQGIPPDMKPALFKRVVGGKGKFDLFFVHEFLSISGMSITETGTQGKGTRFEITVPRQLYRISRKK